MHKEKAFGAIEIDINVNDRSIKPQEQLQANQQWVMASPVGKITTRDGRLWDLTNPEEVIEATTADGIERMVDYNHASEYHALLMSTLSNLKGAELTTALAEALQLNPSPAGWVKKWRMSDDGTAIWALVEWTEMARYCLTSKSYRYISPSVYHDKNGKVLGFTSLALVNRPALSMPAVASEQTQHTSLKDRMAQFFGLTQQEQQVAKENNEMDKTVLAQLEGVYAELATERATKATALAELDTTKKELANYKEKEKTATAERVVSLVDCAIASGKLTPAGRDNALAMASLNPVAFSEMMQSMPALAHTTGTPMPALPTGATALAQSLVSAEAYASLQLAGFTDEQIVMAHSQAHPTTSTETGE